MHKNEIQYDVIIPIGPDDVKFLPRVIEYLIRCLGNDINCIYILTAKKNFVKLSNKLQNVKKCQLVDEDSLLPNLTLKRVHDLLYKYAPERTSRTGWYFQQFLKMGFSRSSRCDSYYLSWDSDTLPLAPIRFFDGDNILYNPKPEYNPNYFVAIKRLLGIERLSDYSFISESMMFSAEIMKDLLGEIERSNNIGEDWIEKIIAAGDYTNPLPSFSEFETYGNFCLQRYPGLYKERHLNTFREGGYIAGRNIKEKQLQEMSFDVDTISFEMFHEPLFPYNLPYIYFRIRKKIKKISRLGFLECISFIFKRVKAKDERGNDGLLSKIKCRLPDKN